MLKVDVCILGAGMAGLTLAHQLKDRRPELDVVVVEHRAFPVPVAAHKVGESTVEIAAHYLADTLNLRAHLEAAQLPKFGLRLFFGGAARPMDLAEFDEVGASRVLPVPTWQLDRGILENHLAATARDRGVSVLDGATIREVAPQQGDHRVTVTHADGTLHISSRFLVDSSGRRAWLRSQRGIARETQHGNGASWFRVEGDLHVDEWGSGSAWRARCNGTPRRLSTNHFMGPGYWAWVIPLASRVTSIGVVYDPRLVEARDVARRDTLQAWLAREQPLLAARLDGTSLLDFHTMRRYAAGCRETYSSDGWMLTGDAGVFADPFYSPGGDFIAIGNTFITELIAGERPDADAGCYQRYLLSFFANTLSLFRGQYAGFGHRDLMVLKTAWDYGYYWAVLAKLFFSGCMTDTAFMSNVQRDLVRAAGLNARMQKQFRALAAEARSQGGAGSFIDHYQVPWFHSLKNDLLHGRPEHAAASLVAGIARLEVLADGVTALLPRVAVGQPLPPLPQVPGLDERPARVSA